jgi:hypothetical protein
MRDDLVAIRRALELGAVMDLGDVTRDPTWRAALDALKRLELRCDVEDAKAAASLVPRCGVCGHRHLDHVESGGYPRNCSVDGCKCLGWRPQRESLAVAPPDRIPGAVMPAPVATQRAAEGVIADEMASVDWDAVNAEMGRRMPAIQTALNEPGPLARLLKEFPASNPEGLNASVLVAERAAPTPNEWQEHVCKAWARAIGLAGVMSSGEPELRTPTVVGLQDATALALRREHSRGAWVILRMWGAAVGLNVTTPGELPSAETCLDATQAIIDAEAERYRELQGVIVKLDAHRTTLEKLAAVGVNEYPATWAAMQAESLKETSESLTETPAAEAAPDADLEIPF